MTVNIKANNTQWTDTGISGACTVGAHSGDSVIHFGPSIPTTYDVAKHEILMGDIPFYYSGTDNLYVRSHGDNSIGVTQKSTIVVTDG